MSSTMPGGSPLPPTLPQTGTRKLPSGEVNCFLVEDSPVIRNNLIATLEEMVSMRVIGTAESEQAATSWMYHSGTAVNLMIIDIFLKSGSGLGVLARAAELMPDARRVVLTNFATPDMRRRCTELGADRVFDKSSELDELIDYCNALVPR